MIKASTTAEIPTPGYARLTIEHDDRPDEHFFIPRAEMASRFEDILAIASANGARYIDEDAAAQA